MSNLLDYMFCNIVHRDASIYQKQEELPKTTKNLPKSNVKHHTQNSFE